MKKYKIITRIQSMMEEVNKSHPYIEKIYELGIKNHTQNPPLAKTIFEDCIKRSTLLKQTIETIFEEFKNDKKLKADLLPLTMVKGENLSRMGQAYLYLDQEAEAIPLLTQAADEFKNKNANLALALIYYKKNHYEKSFNYFIKSPPQDCKTALMLADLYERGYGHEEKEKKQLKATEYYQVAEKFALEEKPPSANTYRNLALCYHLKKLGPASKEGKFWQKAADLGNAEAQHRAARLLEEGSGGLLQDIKAAINRYRQSIAQNYMLAFHDLADLLEEQGGNENMKEAYRLYTQAAPTLPQSKIHQARCLRLGLGVSKNVQQSMAICQEVLQDSFAKDYHSLVSYNLGVIYFEEYDDFMEALKYFQLGANQGCLQSQITLALFYESGLGLEKANTAIAIDWLEKVANNTHSQVDAAKAKIILLSIKLGKINDQLLIACQQEDKKFVSDILTKVSTPTGSNHDRDQPAFKKLNQILVQIAKDQDLYRDEKIRSLFAHIVAANNFNSINLVTALFNIGKLFHSINNQPRLIQYYTREIKLLINRLKDRMLHLEVKETAHALHGLSLLHLDASEEPLSHCIRLLLINAKKNVTDFTPQDLDMAIGAIARFNLSEEELKGAQRLIEEIQNRWAEFNLDQLIHLAYSLAVLDVYQKEKEYHCFKATRLGNQIFSKISAKIPLDSKTLSLELRTQLDLGCRYFNKNSSLRLEIINYQNRKSSWMSRFQKEVTDFISRRRVPTPHDIDTEWSINGLPPVDIYFSDENITVQANGPTHYYYSLDQKSEPKPTLKEQLHHHLLMKECKKVIYISCFEWSKQKTDIERSAYLTRSGIKLTPIPVPVNLIIDGGIQKEWRKKQKAQTSSSMQVNTSPK